MDAIILVGGQGTRLRSVVADVPKPLAPVNGKPFLDLLLEQLSRFRLIERVVLAVGYRAEQIESRYAGSVQFGFQIEISVEAQPMGTGGAILLALPRTRTQRVLVMNGDSFVDFSLESLTAAHVASGAPITMVVVEVEDAARFGQVEVSPAGWVVGFSEKGARIGPGLINAGCYLLESKLFEKMPLQPSSFERDVLAGQLGKMHAYVTRGRFIDIGLPESYAAAADILK